MNKKTFLMAFYILLGASLVEAKQVKVTVKEPGTLSTLIDTKEKYQITDLVLKGALNGSDLRFLREMAGSDVKQQPTAGKLKRVDLSKITFAQGGGSYVNKEGDCYTQGPHTVPKFLFRNCKIEKVVLPVRTDTIDTGALEYTHLKKIELPDNVILCGWVFNCDSMLEEVIFPKYVRMIGGYCFTQCPKLKKLSFNNIDFIPANSITDMSALEVIEIKGYLGHIDGWNTISLCPKLRQIDFYGPVLSTGGPQLVNNCPRLQSITFHGPVYSINLGAAEKCPQFKGYRMKDIVFESGDTSMIPATPKDQLQKSQHYVTTLSDFRGIIENADKWGTNKYLLSHLLASDLYNEACRYSLKGNKKRALDFLQTAIKAGYKDYSHMKEDSDFSNIKNEKRFAELLESARLVADYLYILKLSEPYERTGKSEPRFTYAAPTDSNLARVRKFFNLDSIAGKGDEISRMKNLLYWLHDAIRHNGSSSWPKCPYNAIDLYKICKKENRGLNCRFMAMMLNEIYLAEGFKSRFITCESKAYDSDGDCHVINMVWSHSLHKWVWMDPTFCAFVTDENGLLLHPGEVRERLVNDQPLVLNEDANWNHENKQTKEDYLENYMAKNLYLITSHLISEYETESNSGRKSPSVTLSPKGFIYGWGNSTHDDAYFWQAPEGEE